MTRLAAMTEQEDTTQSTEKKRRAQSDGEPGSMVAQTHELRDRFGIDRPELVAVALRISTARARAIMGDK